MRIFKKQIEVLTVVLLIATSLFAEKIPGVPYERYKSLSEVVLEKLNRPVIVMVLDNSCVYCKEEVLEMSNDRRILEILRNDILLVVAFKDRDKIDPKISGAMMVPAFYPIDPDRGRFFVAARPAAGKIEMRELERWMLQIKKAYDEKKRRMFDGLSSNSSEETGEKRSHE